MEIEVCFIFYKGRRDLIFNNDEIYTIRREVSRCFQHAQFGASFEVEGDKFNNEYAIPIDDIYNSIDHELHIGYVFHTPIQQGDLNLLLSIEFSNLHEWIINNYPDTLSIFRVTYV